MFCHRTGFNEKKKKNPQTNSNDLFVANRGERRSEMQIHNVHDRAGCQYYGAERESATQMGGKKNNKMLCSKLESSYLGCRVREQSVC